MTFEVKKQNDKYAIFDGNKQITEWFNSVWFDGLVLGESNYFEVSRYGV